MSLGADWCARMFAALKDGGVWGIPRTGLVFERRGSSLILIDVMSYEPGMLSTADELALAQAEEYNQIKGYLEEVGITVGREVGI